MTDPNKIITEGKFDENMFEDPALVFIDLVNEEYEDADADLMLGEASEMNLMDIVLRDDPLSIKLDREEVTYNQIEAM